MDLSGCISLVVALVVGGATVAIGISQVRLSKRQEVEVERQGAVQEKMLTSQDTFMREQVAIANTNAQAMADREADEYLRSYHENRGLVPLAAMAELYGSSQDFCRPLYVDFLRLSQAAQDSVFARLKIVRPKKLGGNFWPALSERLERDYKERFPEDRHGFHDAAKYMGRAFTVYRREPIPKWPITLPDEVVALRPASDGPIRWASGSDNVAIVGSNIEYLGALTDVLAAAFRDKELRPLELMLGNLIPAEQGVRACYSECMFAGYFAMYLGMESKPGFTERPDYGSPGSFEYEVLETMEDVFLWALFQIYTNLLLPDTEAENSEATTHETESETT